MKARNTRKILYKIARGLTLQKHTRIQNKGKMMSEIKRLVVGIGGASGVHLGLRFIESVPDSIQLFVILSDGAKDVASNELGVDIEECLDMLRQKKSFRIYDEDELDSGVASGSFGIDAMALVPTSMNLLAKIANGLCDELISRCASVMLKEHRTLLLAPREMPLSHIALKQMSKLAALGVIIAPPCVGYYAKPTDLESMERFFIGKWLDALKIPNNLYHRWKHDEYTQEQSTDSIKSCISGTFMPHTQDIQGIHKCEK